MKIPYIVNKNNFKSKKSSDYQDYEFQTPFLIAEDKENRFIAVALVQHKVFGMRFKDSFFHKE